MTGKEKKILFTAISIFALMTGFLIYTYPEHYNEQYIDKLTHDILKNKGSLTLIEEFLKYRSKTAIDASFYLHYYGNLYFIYTKYPNNVLHFKDYFRYRLTIDTMLKDGKGCFEDYYPDGWK